MYLHLNWSSATVFILKSVNEAFSLSLTLFPLPPSSLFLPYPSSPPSFLPPPLSIFPSLLPPSSFLTLLPLPPSSFLPYPFLLPPSSLPALSRYLSLYRDLYGAVTTPLRITRTIVTGQSASLVCRLLYLLTYFIRCSEVQPGFLQELMAGADFHQDPDKVSGSIRVRSKKNFSSCQTKMFSGSFMQCKYEVHACVCPPLLLGLYHCLWAPFPCRQ